MFWQDNYFSSSFFKKNINSNSRFSYVNSDYAKTSEQKYSAGNKCFEKSSDSSSYETFVDYSEGANILEQMSWSKLCSDFFNTFFANRNVVSDSTDQASTDNSYGSGTNDGIMTLAMLEEGGSSLDGQISTKAMYEEGGSDSIGGSTGDDTSGETNLNDGIMTLAMLEEGGSSLDGQISTKKAAAILTNQVWVINLFGGIITGDTTTGAAVLLRLQCLSVAVQQMELKMLNRQVPIMIQTYRV